jgi:hypothetical protein
MRLDRYGRFDLPGTHMQMRGGPQRENQEPSREPARYTGRVSGKTMELSVTLTGSKEKLGDFSLTRGRQARLFKCL